MESKINCVLYWFNIFNILRPIYLPAPASTPASAPSRPSPRPHPHPYPHIDDLLKNANQIGFDSARVRGRGQGMNSSSLARMHGGEGATRKTMNWPFNCLQILVFEIIHLFYSTRELVYNTVIMWCTS